MTVRYDTVVIGAGAMGSAAAWWLARRGREVLLVEQFDRGHTKGSSHGGSRIFRYAYADPALVGDVLRADPVPLVGVGVHVTLLLASRRCRISTEHVPRRYTTTRENFREPPWTRPRPAPPCTGSPS